jgi:hypothetical protein
MKLFKSKTRKRVEDNINRLVTENEHIRHNRNQIRDTRLYCQMGILHDDNEKQIKFLKSLL